MLVTRTKVITPGRRSDLLSRPRLLNLLQRLIDYKLIVISAPAGYGKTSLLVDFSHEADLPVCWYALDQLDQNPQRFVAHFIAALQEKFPGLSGLSQAAQSTGDFDLDRAVATISNEVYENVREHFIVVLDDYHLVEDSAHINYLVNQLIVHLDENAHLIISSRTLPALPDMSLLVGRNQVGGLDFETLAFRSGEIQSLMEQNYDLVMADGDARQIMEETEGWITGLLLSAQTMWQGMIEQLQHARVSGVDLYDYLLRGDASSDIRLEHGDRVFVPPAGPQVRIQGAVRRPAIYEVRPGEEGVADVLAFAGGLQAEAVVRRVQIDRILPPGERTGGRYRVVRDVDLVELFSGGAIIPVRDGDVIHVLAVPDHVRDRVWITGAVNNPGIFEWSPGTTLADLVSRADGLTDPAYTPRLQIYRLDPATRQRRMLQAMAPGGGGVDPDEWMGFYVNIGMDRLAMMRYGIDDVRLFHSADLRFLYQFT